MNAAETRGRRSAFLHAAVAVCVAKLRDNIEQQIAGAGGQRGVEATEGIAEKVLVPPDCVKISVPEQPT